MGSDRQERIRGRCVPLLWYSLLCRLAALVLLAGTGCTSLPSTTSSARPFRDTPFRFQADTFTFANQLRWEYHLDANGHWKTEPRVPKPSYTLHCFVVVRAARQFYQHARFDPSLPRADGSTYRKKIHRVLTAGVAYPSAPGKRVLIPGYADLRSFSRDYGALIRSEAGGAWRCYLQRGNWRMIFPFSRHHQETMAFRLLRELNEKRAPIVHLVRFPQLTINHAVLIYGKTETLDTIRFLVYDPNTPEHPIDLIYRRQTRTFSLPPTLYFHGGRVDVYEVYCGWPY